MAIAPFPELLERAFCAARDAGKTDWHRMIIGVLKNRLLQLTNREFEAARYGARSLSELLARHPELVEIDRTVEPMAIEWRGALVLHDASCEAGRVRRDLWRAILDLSSGLEYEWDPATRCARGVAKAAPHRRLPTVDAATLALWRTTFAASYRALLSDPADHELLRRWVATALGKRPLPAPLRAAWREHLVREVIARLTGWFHGTGHPTPGLFRIGLPRH